MREITIKVYQYSELSEKAKERARHWYLEGLDTYYVWEDLKADAKSVGLILYGTNNRGNMKGGFEKSAEDCAKRIIAEHGEKCETYKTAAKFVEDRKKIFSAHADDECETGLTFKGDNALGELEDEFLCEICEDYRINLEKEYEYQSSEECITENMAANEYEFDENGRRI